MRIRPDKRGSVPAASRAGVAFALSGGGSHGAAQVGMLRALLEAGVVPDAMVGCSVGALNATFVAAEPTPDQVDRLAQVWSRLTARSIFGNRSGVSVWNLLTGRNHLLPANRLTALIDVLCPVDDLADLAVPTHIVTTDLEAGAAAWWTSGPARQILAASSCLPALFPPVQLPGPGASTRPHVDGGVAAPVPVARAVTLGVRTVYVLDVSGERQATPSPMNALGVLLRAFTISRYANLPAPADFAEEGQEIVTLPCPDMTGIGLRDFSGSARLMDEAYRMTANFLAARAAEQRAGDAAAPVRPRRRRAA